MIWYQKMFVDKHSVHIRGVLWAISVLVTLSIFGNVVHNFSDILNVQHCLSRMDFILGLFCYFVYCGFG